MSRTAAVLVLLALLAASPGEAQIPAASSRTPINTGSVRTVAGPGICEGSATIDETSQTTRALAVETSGRFYFDTGRPDQAVVGTVSPQGQATLLRSATPGASAAYGPKSRSQEWFPGRLVADSDGVLAASRRHVVRMSAGGTEVRTLAGNPFVAGYPGPKEGAAGGGDVRPALDSRFTRILSMAGDPEGNLYIADELNSKDPSFRIRFMNRSSQPISFYDGTTESVVINPGDVGPIAGGAEPKGSPPTQRASAVRLEGKQPSMAASADRLYIATSTLTAKASRQSAIRVVNLGGQTLITHGRAVGPGEIKTVPFDAGPGIRAPQFVPGMTIGRAGNLFLADQAANRILEVDSMGRWSVFAGRGKSAPTKSGGEAPEGPGANADLRKPFDVKTAGTGIYISDSGNHVVKFVDQSGAIRTAPGSGVGLAWKCQPVSGASGTYTSPLRPVQSGGVETPTLMTVAAGKNAVYQAKASGQVFQISPPNMARLVASNSRSGCKGKPASAIECTRIVSGALGTPVAIASARRGGIYVIDTSGKVRFLNTTRRPLMPNGKKVKPGRVATLNLRLESAAFAGLAADSKGGLFVSQAARFFPKTKGRITYVDSKGISTEILALPNENTQPAACCGSPLALALDRADNLYVSDKPTGQVWLYNRSRQPLLAFGQQIAAGKTVPIAGGGGEPISEGRPALQAKLQPPLALAVDERRNVYLTQTEEHTVRKIDPTGKISTVAGTGILGFNGDGQPAKLTSLDYPTSLAVDGCGNLFIADARNDRVRELVLATNCPLGAKRF